MGGWGWMLPTDSQDLSSVDIYTENSNLVVEVSMPGMKKEEIQLNARDGRLDISAEHEESEISTAVREDLLHESSHSYHRQISLPEGARVGKAEVAFANGKLLITIPMEKRKDFEAT